MENFWVSINKHFSSHGIESFLVYPKITSIPETISCTNIEASELNFADHSLNNIKRIYRFLKDRRIEHLYLSDSPTNGLFYILLRLFGIKKIVVHDHTPGERTRPSGPLKTYKYIRQRIPFYNVDHIIAVTDYIHQRHIQISRIPKQRCSTARNGITPIDLTEIDRHYTYEQFGIAESKVIIVTTGRASYYKGIDFFIRCADELINKQGLDNLHFLFCGDGPDMDDFIALSKECELDEHFTFAGKRSDIRKILPSCSIGFHAATGEVGYSLSILEYMSAGLITIVPDNPSTSLATSHMHDGLLYTPRDIKSATTAIKLALEMKDKNTLQANAINKVKENFSIEQTNAMLIKILDDVYT
jgi:glycosyltransferase involved in cell wall biosynthesis